MPNNDNLKTLYKSLYDNGYDVPKNYDDFEYTLSSENEGSEEARKALHQSLYNNGYDVPEKYDDFAYTLWGDGGTGGMPEGVTTEAAVDSMHQAGQRITKDELRDVAMGGEDAPVDAQAVGDATREMANIGGGAQAVQGVSNSAPAPQRASWTDKLVQTQQSQTQPKPNGYKAPPMQSPITITDANGNQTMTTFGDVYNNMSGYYNRLMDSYDSDPNAYYQQPVNHRGAFWRIDDQLTGMGLDESTRKSLRSYVSYNAVLPKTDALAKKLFDKIGDSHTDPYEQIRDVYYSDEFQDELDKLQRHSGIDMSWLVENMLIPALKRVGTEKWGYDVGKHVRGLFSKPQHIAEERERRKWGSTVEEEADMAMEERRKRGETMTPEELLEDVQNTLDWSRADREQKQRYFDAWKNASFGEQMTGVVKVGTRLNPDTGATEDVYMNATGKEYFGNGGKAVADKEQEALTRQVKNSQKSNKQLVRESLETMEGDTDKMLDEAIRDASGRSASFASFGYPGGVRPQDAFIESDSRVMELRAAKRTFNTIRDIIEAADRQTKGGYTALGETWRGLRNKAFDPYTWDFGISDLKESQMMKDILDKFDNGEALTESEMMLLDSKALELAANTYFGSDMSRFYKAGQVTGESLPFMVEMCLNPLAGAGRAGAKLAVKKLARYGLARFGSKATRAAINAIRLGGDIAASVGMTFTTGIFRTTADAYNRYNGHVNDFDYNTAPSGKVSVKATGHEKGEESLLKAIGKAVANTTIENFSEMMGEYFAPFLRGLGKVGSKVATSKFGKKIYLSKVDDFIKRAKGSDLAKMISDFERQAKWNGLLGEFAEEMIGGALNALLVGDQTLDNDKDTGLFNGSNIVDTFLGVSVLGGFFSGIKTLGYRTPKYDARKAMQKAEKTAAATFIDKDRWDAFKQAFEQYDSDNVKAMLAGVMADDTLSANEKRAAAEYAQAASAYQGMLKADDKRRGDDMEDPTQVAAEEAYDNGYNNEDEATAKGIKDAYDECRSQMLSAFGEQEVQAWDANPMLALQTALQNGSLTDEQRQLALDYVNAKAAFDGMNDRKDDDVEDKQAEVNAAVDIRVNSAEQGGDGKIHPVTLNDEREVDVVGGNVVSNDDGSINTEKSDNDLIVRDRETGKVEFVSANAVSGVGEVIDPDTLKQEAAAVVQEESEQQSTGDVVADNEDATEGTEQPVQAVEPTTEGQEQGGITFNGGEHYEFTDDKGKDYSIDIVEDLGDGFVEVSENGGEPRPMLKETLLRYLAPEEESATETESQPASAAQGQAADAEEDTAGDVVPVAYEPQNAPQDTPVMGERNGQQVLAPTAETGVVSDLNEPMPMKAVDGKSKPDYDSTTPQRTRKYLYDELGLSKDEADKFAEMYRDRAAKEFEELRNQEPRIEDYEEADEYAAAKRDWETKSKDAERRRDYWEEVRNPKAEEKPVEQQPTSAAQESAPAQVQNEAPAQTEQPQAETQPEITAESAQENPAEEEQAQQENVAENASNEGQGESNGAEAEGTQYSAEQLAAETERQAENRKKENLRRRAMKWAERLGVKPVLLERPEDVPQSQGDARQLLMEGEKVFGWIDRRSKTIYLYMPNINSAWRLDRTIMHETVGHYGLKELFNGKGGKETFDSLCDAVFDMMPQAAKDKYLNYANIGKIKDETKRRRAAADEYMAHMAEEGDYNPSIIRRIKTAIKELLRKWGIDMRLTDDDIVAMLRQSQRNLEKQGEAKMQKATNKAVGGGVDGTDNGLMFSVSAIMEGAGLDAVDTEDIGYIGSEEGGYKNMRTDKDGNVIVSIGGKTFSGKNLLKPSDLKKAENSALNYMIKYAIEAGTIGNAEADTIRKKYCDIINAFLVAGLNENGGSENLQRNWLWLGETVFRTIKTNGDKQYSYSMDVTAVCKKNEAVIREISEMQQRLGYGITPSQIIDIYRETDKQGYQVPCPVCYVFSRYIRNGKYASAAINGMVKYGEHLPNGSDPWTVEQWQAELERIEKANKSVDKAITKANEDVSGILDVIDNLGMKLMDKNTSEQEKAELKKKIDLLDRRYRAALQLNSQQSLTNWIKSFALKSEDGVISLREDSLKPEDMEDFKNCALDLRRTAEAITKYPGIQRLRKSGGSAAGKEITFASNNDLGDVVSAVGTANPAEAVNWYKAAAEAKTQEEREQCLDKAKDRFQKSVLYAARQSLRGGQRMWSWSDNIEELSPDIAINLMQLELLGGAVQTYSKQLEGINMAASMDAYVNGSLMAKDNGYREVGADDIEEVDGKKVLSHDITETVYETVRENGKKRRRRRERVLAEKGSPIYSDSQGDYVLVFDDIIGVDPHGRVENGKKKMGLFDLNKMLSRAGNIMVGMNDRHIRACLSDPRMFFIIPWHASGQSVHILKQMLAVLGTKMKGFVSTDYTSMQEEKDWMKVPKGETRSKKMPKKVIEIWDESKSAHEGRPMSEGKEKGKFACGIAGGVENAGSDGRVSDSQRHYRELRKAIFDGSIEDNAAWLEEVKNDEFLSQVYESVHALPADSKGRHTMTGTDNEFIYPYEYWDKTSTFDSADVNGERYIEYSRRLGFSPKFSGNYGKNGKWTDEGNFIHDKGYWKLLIDRRMYDVNGDYQDLTPIRTSGFRPEYIDHTYNDEHFTISQVADDAGAKEVVDKVMETEAERASLTEGGIPNVEFNPLTDENGEEVSIGDVLKKAAAAYNATRNATKGMKMKAEPVERNYEEEGDLLFSIGGERGAENDAKAKSNLNTAKEMEKAGEDENTIWLATGWQKGVDGKWRYEIPDAVLKPDAKDTNSLHTVGSLIDAPELFDAYPALKDIKVRFKRMADAGSYHYDDNEIELDEKYNSSERKDEYGWNHRYIDQTGLETLLHELQHAIQHIEGFANGGNSYSLSKDYLDEATKNKPETKIFLNGFGQNSLKNLLNGRDQVIKLLQRDFDKEVDKRNAKLLLGYLNTLSPWEYYDFVRAAKGLQRKASREGNVRYNNLAGEVEARNVEKRHKMSDEERRNTMLSGTEDVRRGEQIVRYKKKDEDSTKSKGGDLSFSVDEVGESEAEESEVMFSVVDDPKEIERLEKAPKVKRYRAMVEIDGKLYPPMSVYVDGKLREPTEIGTWEKSDETPITDEQKAAMDALDAKNGAGDVVIIPGKLRYHKGSKNGKGTLQFRLQKDNGSDIWAAYNPYFHTSTSGMNDQFTSAWKRPNLVVVEVEIPEEEAKGGYKADFAKDSTGDTPWHSGTVNGQLPADRQRTVTLAQHAKVTRVVPDAEVAEGIAKQLEGLDIEVPFNVVSPGLREELVKRGVKIGAPEKGNAGKASISAYEAWKTQQESDVMFSISPAEDAEYMSAVENGDMATAERMVKEAAKRAGYDTFGLHGTRGEFTVFDRKRIGSANDDGWLGRGFYFWDKNNRDYANQYARGGKVMEVYLKAEEPYPISDEEMDMLMKAADEHDIDTLEDFTEDLINNDYDSVVDTNGQILVFDPNQIKSADPVTYDDAGKPIPLSERFNPEKDDIRFSVGEDDIFVSNAMRAVESIKQEKATPEQWLAMIQKAGGLKAAEDKWLGLSDWLKGHDKKSLTKDEVLEFIRENQVQVEEVEYGSIDEEEIADIMENEIPGFKDTFIVWSTNDGGVDFVIRNEEKAVELYNAVPANTHKAKYRGGLSREDKQNIHYWIDTVADNALPKAKGINATRLNYTTKGLDNNKEIALVVPTIEPWNESDDVHFGDAGEGRAVAWIRFGETTTNMNGEVASTRIMDELESKYGSADAFDKMSDEDLAKRYFANILYRNGMGVDSEKGYINRHFGDRAGNIISILNKLIADNAKEERVLVIDEIQSKRHQEGRENGYFDNDEYNRLKEEESRLGKEAEDEIAKADKYAEKLFKKYGIDTQDERKAYEELSKIWTKEEEAEYNDGNDIIERANEATRNREKYERNNVPDAPFEKNWHELAMKRMLRYAAENGYDKVAWTKGAQQAERYNLGNVLDNIVAGEWDDAIGDVWDEEGACKEVFASDKSGSEVLNVVINSEGKIIADINDTYSGRMLSDVVGKDIALRLMKDGKQTVEGVNLRTGGEGMKGFYDQMLPSFMNKYGKKWGVKVGEVELPNVEKAGRTMWAVDVTPEMKESVMQGQTMFNVGEDEIDEEENEGVAPDDVNAARENIERAAGDNWVEGLWGNEREALLRLSERRDAQDGLKTQAINAIVNELMRLRDRMPGGKEYRRRMESAMKGAERARKDFDRESIADLVKLVRQMMAHNRTDNLSLYETSRLIGMVGEAAGKDNAKVMEQARKVISLLLKHQLRETRGLFFRMLSTKGTKVNAKGVEVQGSLDADGERMMRAFKDAMKLDAERLQERMADCTDRMGDENDEVSAKNAAIEMQGLMLVKQYMDEVEQNIQEEQDIREGIRQEKERYSPNKQGLVGDERKAAMQAHREFMQEAEDSLFENWHERINAYERLMSSMGEGIAESMRRAREWRDEQQRIVNEIHHNANSDLEGMNSSEHDRVPKKRGIRHSIVQFFMNPLATANEMFRDLGRKHPNGEGYLWHRFIGGWRKASDQEWRNLHAAHLALDKKVSEVMGRNMRWSDLFTMERKMKGMPVEFWDNGEKVSYELTQGNMLYIYMVNKMSDGRMKLRRMGITEEDVEAIKENLDPRFIELADWLQDEFLVQKRNEYNAVHERMFGAAMASIDNYFPLKINARSRGQQEDVAEYENDEHLGGTVTGSVIKRRKNALPLDVTGADAFDVVLEHLQQMEHWAAFAELSRDLGTLLSYRRFKNRLLHMKSVRFGTGQEYWDNFKNVCAILTGNYRPKTRNNGLDKTLMNVAKGVTGAKISFRIYTAFKQLLSSPAYLSEASPLALAKNNPITGGKAAFKWAIENLPGFAERWQGRKAGDTRLNDTDSDWDLWHTKFVENATRYGMTPNAAVDALTVACGAKAIYETKKSRYLKDGYSEEQANEKALRDASISYNETQQSSEAAFVSAAQLDRTAASVALTVFRNCSMGYQRRLFRAFDNLRQRAKKGYRDDAIEYMTKQMVRDGLSEEQAAATAKRAYRRGLYKDMADVAIFGWVLQFAWNLGPNLIYLLVGGDDDEKEAMLTDAAVHALFGGVEGLAAGNVISDSANALIKGDMNSPGSGEFNLLPFLSDLKKTIKDFNSDWAKGATDLVNLLVQANIGVNPQTLSDVFVALADLYDGDMDAMKEGAFLLMRILQFPSGQLEKLQLDELGLTSKGAHGVSAEDLMRRMARYREMRQAPLFRLLYNDEQSAKAAERGQKRFDTLVREKLDALDDDELLKWQTDDPYLEDIWRKRIDNRVKDMDDATLEEAYDLGGYAKKKAGGEIAKRMKDSFDTGEKKKEDEGDSYGKLYDDNSSLIDLSEDVTLNLVQTKAQNDGDDELYNAIKKAKSNITKMKKVLLDVPYTNEYGEEITAEDVMRSIRDYRNDVINELGIVVKR